MVNLHIADSPLYYSGPGRFYFILQIGLGFGVQSVLLTGHLEIICSLLIADDMLD